MFYSPLDFHAWVNQNLASEFCLFVVFSNLDSQVIYYFPCKTVTQVAVVLSSLLKAILFVLWSNGKILIGTEGLFIHLFIFVVPLMATGK